MPIDSILPARAQRAAAHGVARPDGSPRQRGVAVVTALLIVALATLAVTGVMWRQQVQVRSVENQIALAETRWLARGAIDWTRTMLAYDARKAGDIDHLGEFWAVPMADTKIADAEDGGLRDGYLSGQIVDEQGKYNLLNLSTKGEVDEVQVTHLSALLAALGIDTALATPIAQAVADTESKPASDGNTEAPAALPMLVVDDLLRVSGIDASTVERLRPHVALLPRGGSDMVKVNANTASAEVLHAAVPRLPLQQAQVLVAQRGQAFQYFLDAERFKIQANAFGVGLETADLKLLDVKSSYFRVQGRIRYDRALVSLEALVYRSGSKTRVLWHQEY